MRALFFFLVLGVVVQAQSNSYSVEELLTKMDSSITSNNEIKFTFLKQERVKGEFRYSSSEVKVQKNDGLNIYMRSNTPREGLEILYREGQNENNVLINTNSFPFINMNLDPWGDLIRDNQHHTIHDLGFYTIQGMFRNFKTSMGDSLSKFIERSHDVVWEGYNCYRITVSYPHFDYVKYEVLKDETIDDVANKFNVSAYMILEKNDFSDYDDIDEGDVILVPNLYAKYCEVYLAKDNFLPVRQVILDDQGIYEKYEYLNVNVNPKFDHNELDHKYTAYGF